MTEVGIWFLEGVRFFLYMRLAHLVAGEYRGGRRLTAAAFFVLWALEGFLRSLSPLGAETMLSDLFFFMVEIPVLFLLAFCYRGKFAGRLGTALFLPTIYWAFKWTVMAAVFRGREVSGHRYFLATALAVLLLFFLALLLGKVRKSRRERERERLEAEVLMYERQFDLIQSSRQAVRALKHDMKHHVKMLSDLVEAGEKEAALAYLSSMEEFMEPVEEYVDSGNESIDSVLNYMISRAKSGKASVDWKICIPERLPIPAFDMNVILSNLLENALEALLAAEEPVLSIRLTYDRNVLGIQIKNSCSRREQTQARRERHGLGLENVLRIVERYHGSLRIFREAGWFRADVLLFLP